MREGRTAARKFTLFLHSGPRTRYHCVNPQQVTCAAPLNLR